MRDGVSILAIRPAPSPQRSCAHDSSVALLAQASQVATWRCRLRHQHFDSMSNILGDELIKSLNSYILHLESKNAQLESLIEDLRDRLVDLDARVVALEDCKAEMEPPPLFRNEASGASGSTARSSVPPPREQNTPGWLVYRCEQRPSLAGWHPVNWECLEARLGVERGKLAGCMRKYGISVKKFYRVEEARTHWVRKMGLDVFPEHPLSQP